MHYWLHRVSYEGGDDDLDSKNILTIGYAKIADESALKRKTIGIFPSAECPGLKCKNETQVIS